MTKNKNAQETRYDYERFENDSLLLSRPRESAHVQFTMWVILHVS